MRLSRAANAIFLMLLVLTPLYFGGGQHVFDAVSELREGVFTDALENSVRKAMPMSLRLEGLGLDLRLLGGKREQNGIFISDQALMRDIDPPIEMYVRQNSEALEAFAERLHEASSQRKDAYLAIIPTSGGVLQQHLPRFAQSGMVGQKRLIEDLYSRVSASVRTVDVYSALYNRRNQYIYYRTENNLTALGGFYAYTAIGRRMGLNNRSLSQFEIEYIDYPYYGDLYRSAPGAASWKDYAAVPYRSISPDTLSLFRYSRTPREYLVTHINGTEEKTYHTLFPKHLMEYSSAMEVYLGGSSAVTEIRTSSPTRSRLLVFGDKTALAYMPFLVNHYQLVTLVNLYLIAPSDIAGIHPGDYDQVLFAYSLESYIHTNDPAKLSRIDWDKTP